MNKIYSYPIISNCNFSDREPGERGWEVNKARKAIEAGLTRNEELLDAMDALEETLGEYAEDESEHAIRACRDAEDAVSAAWTDEVQEEVDAARNRNS